IIYRTNGNEVVGKQGRRVSASRTTVPRVGAHVWRPRRAGYPVPHGSGMAAVSRFDCTSAAATYNPTATATPAYGRGQVSRASCASAGARWSRAIFALRGEDKVDRATPIVDSIRGAPLGPR